jgi:fatty-acyl-CoA synthase
VSASFGASAVLEQIPEHAVSVLAVVPVLLQRLLDAPEFDEADLSTLRIVASSGSALPIPTVVDWLHRGGPNLYNLYGSTEVGQATLATPTDLSAYPDTAGRALDGSEIGILDDDGTLLPAGSVGRIFVGSSAQFDGYTGGGGKEIVQGLMSTGDVGYLDETGLLFVTGRADDMIVSGGENVFPQEVEDVLLADDRIADVAVVGVPDDDFGERLKAFVVRAPGVKITKSEARALVADQLARHKVPRDVTFCTELPRTSTGKIQRTEL